MSSGQQRSFLFNAQTLFDSIISVQIVLIEFFNCFWGITKNFLYLLEKTFNDHVGPVIGLLIFSLGLHFDELTTKFFKIWKVFEQRITSDVIFGIFDLEPQVFQRFFEPNIVDLVLEHELMFWKLKFIAFVFDE